MEIDPVFICRDCSYNSLDPDDANEHGQLTRHVVRTFTDSFLKTSFYNGRKKT